MKGAQRVEIQKAVRCFLRLAGLGPARLHWSPTSDQAPVAVEPKAADLGRVCHRGSGLFSGRQGLLHGKACSLKDRHGEKGVLPWKGERS